MKPFQMVLSLPQICPKTPRQISKYSLQVCDCEAKSDFRQGIWQYHDAFDAVEGRWETGSLVDFLKSLNAVL
jgi:hypothetical protein